MVILVPAYVLAVMFEALEPPELLLRHAWDDIKTELLGMDPRVFSVGELKALSGGKRPMLRCVQYGRETSGFQVKAEGYLAS